MKVLPNLRGAAACGAALLLAALSACGGGDSAGTTTSMPVTQGTLQTTDRALDLAIVGDGLFALVDERGQPLYSREGRFYVDRDGQLVQADGWRVAGRPGDDAPGDLAVALAPLRYQMPGRASTQVQIVANLDSRTALHDASFDALDPSTYDMATSGEFHDGLGRPMRLTLYMIHTATDRYAVHAAIDDTVLNGPVAQLVFRPDGALDPASSQTPPLDIPALGDGAGSAGLQIDWSGSVNVGSNFAVWELRADGHAPGGLTAVEIDRSGRITTRYDNGQSRPAGQLLLARFALGDELQRVGTSGLRCVQRCSAPIVAPPGRMLLGEIVAGALEALP